MNGVRTLAGGARVAASLLARAASHAAWYVQYRLHGTSHDAPPPPRGRR